MEEQLPHTNLSHYRIVSKIGAGGMGEVYLAEDLRLRRKVALKVLPEEIAADADRLRRFEREAQSASALNHPNIVTVHEFGVESGIHFLVMELVEGATLREKIKSDELALEEILDIAQQAAFALSAAHSAAIIHRDLKPENIMLRRDGIVKVLDFGLAKLAAPVVGNVDSEEKTLVQITNQTSHGVVVGTLQYMSPEQVRGQPLDARSDIFSLGVVLYEMLAGKRPFDKPTSIDVIAAILTETPPPVSHERHAITPELQRIVSKALNKDRDERYQSSKELLDDLKSLREEVKISASPKRVASKEQAHHSEVERPLMKVTAVRRFSRLSVLAILSLAGLAIVFVAWLIFKSTSRPITIYPSALETAVVANWQSSPGELYSVGSFSPDGKEIAFTSTKIGSKNIWIKRLLGEEAVQVTKDEFANQSPIWAPNGDEIAFYSIRGGTPGIWRIHKFGGTPKFVTAIQDSGMMLRYWSKKDFIYYEANHNFYALDLKTSQVTQLTNLDADKLNPNTISISRDEQQIAYVTFENDQYVISTMPVRGSAAKPIVRSANEIRNLAWHPDNRRIFYSALVSGVFQIFVIDIEASQPVQLTFADRDNLVLDVSEDGTKILYGSSKEEADVWSVQVANGDETSLAADINSELWADVSPDGKVVAYQSINNLSQGNKLFSGAIVTRPITPNAQPLQLISNGFLPLWSPDGTQLAFMRVSGETYNLWSIKADGGAEKQLTLNGMFSVGFSVLPYNRMQTSDFSWSPDGKKIAYMPKQGNAQNIYLVDTTDSVSVPLTNNTNANLSVFCPLWSSDGKRLAYSSSLSAVADKGSVYTVSVIDVESKNTKSFTQPWPVQRLLGWSHTGRELILAALNTQARTTSPAEVELVQVDCETGAQRQLARLEAAYFFNIHLSKDKKTIAYVSHRDDKDNVWVRRLEGSEERKLTSNVDPRLYYSSLSWSSDSRAIYFGKQKRYSLLSMISNFK